ncbi:MAG: hypothetical protein ACK4Q5_06075 [Saprospiraceae bacterium]
MRRARLSNSLWGFAPEDDAGRYPIVQEIKSLTRQINVAKSGAPTQPALPKQKEVAAPTNVLEALRAKQNAMTNISKWKKKLAAAPKGSAAHEAAAAKIAQFNITVASCDKIINSQ